MTVGGTCAPNPVEFECSCVFLKGGKEIKKEIVDKRHAGNVFEGFFGDHIKSCTLRKTSTDGEIHLEISEDNKEIFKSESETTDKPIVYEAKF